jgi:DNA-binding MarR family transcriptional regulator/KaiC/GvpD/RAD55 family RecA-like ATPase
MILQTLTKKPVPNPQEQAIIETLSKIKDGRISGQEAIESLNLPARWKEIVKELYAVYMDVGTEGYWNAYEALYHDHSQLKDWRKFVETSAAPDDQPEDKRFTTDATGKRLLKLSSTEDIYNIPDANYLIAKTLEVSSVSLLYGMSGTGKTFTALHLALSVAHGQYWYGRKVKCGPVWFVNTEGGRSLKKRIKAWYIAHDELEPTDNFKIIPWSLDLREYLQELTDTLDSAREKPVLIVLDNFSMCVAGIDQNKQDEVTPILRSLHAIAEEYGSHVMLVHHTNKEGDFNGTMAFRNHVDAMIELRKEDKADKNSPILFSCQKARDDEPFSDIRTELKSVNMYFDEEEQNFVTSCVTVLCSDGAIKAADLSDTEQNVLDILGDRYLPNNEWKTECMNELKISTSTFDRAVKKLFARKYVEKGKLENKRYEVYHRARKEEDEKHD